MGMALLPLLYLLALQFAVLESQRWMFHLNVATFVVGTAGL